MGVKSAAAGDAISVTVLAECREPLEDNFPVRRRLGRDLSAPGFRRKRQSESPPWKAIDEFAVTVLP
jgi:hypothetical protein